MFRLALSSNIYCMGTTSIHKIYQLDFWVISRLYFYTVAQLQASIIRCQSITDPGLPITTSSDPFSQFLLVYCLFFRFNFFAFHVLYVKAPFRIPNHFIIYDAISSLSTEGVPHCYNFSSKLQPTSNKKMILPSGGASRSNQKKKCL